MFAFNIGVNIAVGRYKKTNKQQMEPLFLSLTPTIALCLQMCNTISLVNHSCSLRVLGQDSE